MKSPLSQWAEWIVTVPMLFYMSLALDSKKPSFDWTDYHIVFCSLWGIFSFFLTICGLSATLNHLFIISSVLNIGIALGAFLTISWNGYNDVISKSDYNDKVNSKQQSLDVVIATRKLVCAVFLNLAFPLFPIVYFMGVFQVIDTNTVLIITLVLNFSVKLMYSVLVSDSHEDVLDPNSFQLHLEIKANDTRRAFLRYILHEVRVPLHSISMGLQILLNNNQLTTEDMETIQMVREAAAFMGETLNDVLSLQKIDDGKLELKNQKTYLRSLIRSVVLSLNGHITSKGIKVSVLITPNIPNCVMADKFRLEHVIANLLSNALKFSPLKARVWIIVKAPEETPNVVTVSVVDEGCGISIEDQEELFKPYGQIRPDELQCGKGTGVGLAICKEIISMHGGVIGVNSKPRQKVDASEEEGGSEFYFTIPLEIVEGEPENEPHEMNENILIPRIKPCVSHSSTVKSDSLSPTTSSTPATSPTSPTATNSTSSSSITSETESAASEENESLMCLIVDDVLTNRKMLQMLLTREGLKCDMACDGTDCLDIIESKGIDHYKLIFMDNLMPKLNGVECSRQLRSLGFKGLILGLTGNALDDDIETFVKAGADTVFSKPLKMANLERLLKHCRQFGSRSVLSMDPALPAAESFRHVTT